MAKKKEKRVIKTTDTRPFKGLRDLLKPQQEKPRHANRTQ